MRLIGVLGGTSWPSTVLPYRLLNQEVERRLGGHHSARIVLYSIDYDAIRSAYTRDPGAVGDLLQQEIETLLGFGPACWMIANNTLHKYFDAIAARVPSEPPMFHAIRLVRDHLLAQGVRRVLLLGTQFTMEDGYYAAPLEAVDIRVEVPSRTDREKVQAIQTRLAVGETDSAFAPWFADLVARHAAAGCEAVIAGCTELPLVLTQDIVPVELVDPLVLQCRACVDFALAG